MDVPQVSGWHRRLFDSDKGPSFVQKPHIVLLFENLKRHIQKVTFMMCVQQAKCYFLLIHNKTN